jgi:hypothetical protein
MLINNGCLVEKVEKVENHFLDLIYKNKTIKIYGN